MKRVATLVLACVSPLCLAAPPDDDAFSKRFIQMDVKEARKNDPFAVLREKPMSENPTLIPKLKAASDTLSPPFLYELARRLWPTNKEEAFEWFVMGMARARYDAFRCTDTTARQAIDFLPGLAPDVSKAIETERKMFGESGLRAIERPDFFTDKVSPSWVCMQGMAYFRAAIEGKPLTEAEWLVPKAEWPNIRNELHKSLREFLIEQNKPQDDPIPMTTSRFPRVTVSMPFGSTYHWLDKQRVVWANKEKNAEGKSISRLMVGTAQGDKEEIATINGPWCAGNGVISYQTAREMLPDKTQKLTLTTGTPGKWVSRTLNLRSTWSSDSFGAQSFSKNGSFIDDNQRMGPFDCRWETSTELSGPKNQHTWMPLLAGDGFIQFMVEGERREIRWITAEGKTIPLNLVAENVSLNGIRHVPWKGGYFISQTWSRFSHTDKALPKCIPGVFLYPREGKIEETCAPFDPQNTANAVMFHPTKVGWLRGTAVRNTAHGIKTGGIYLLRPNGKAEKLVDAQLYSWNVSPDGCQVAFAHEAKESTSALDIINLCQESK